MFGPIDRYRLVKRMTTRNQLLRHLKWTEPKLELMQRWIENMRALRASPPSLPPHLPPSLFDMNIGLRDELRTRFLKSCEIHTRTRRHHRSSDDDLLNRLQRAHDATIDYLTELDRHRKWLEETYPLNGT